MLVHYVRGNIVLSIFLTIKQMTHYVFNWYFHFQWRKFNFFELKQYGDEEIISKILSDSEYECSTTGNNQIIMGDSRGFVHVIPKNFRDTYSFKAHNSITHCELALQNNLLVTLGVSFKI